MIEKIYEFTITPDEVIGDVKTLNEALKPKSSCVSIVNNGIGAYEFWGFRSTDNRFEPEMEDGPVAKVRLTLSEEVTDDDYKAQIDGFLDELDRTWHYSDDEGRYKTDFTLQISDIQQDKEKHVATFTLYWE